MSRITIKKFTFFSLLGTFIWAFIMSSAGYFFGALVEAHLAWYNQYEKQLILGLIVIGLCIGSVIVFLENRKRSRQTKEA